MKTSITEKVLNKIAHGKPADWIKVRAFDARVSDDYKEMYQRLALHHEKETAFLIQICKLLARRNLCECGSEYSRACGGCDNDI